MKYAFENEVNVKILIISKAVTNKRISAKKPHPMFSSLDSRFLLISSPQRKSSRGACDGYAFGSDQTAYSLPLGSLK